MAIKTRFAVVNAIATARSTDSALIKDTALREIFRKVPIVLILLLATFLFTYKIGSEGLWLDELNSLRDITERSPWQLISDPVRPLYYLLMMAWIRTGDSDAWLRLPSVVFAVISVYLLYLLGSQLLSKREGLIAALMLTVSPIVVNHAQEIRMYTLSLCLSLAGTVCLAKALGAGTTERRMNERQMSERQINKHQVSARQISGRQLDGRQLDGRQLDGRQLDGRQLDGRQLDGRQLNEKQLESGSSLPLAGWAAFRLLSMYTVPLNVLLLLPDALIILTRFRQQRAMLIRFGKWLVLLGVLWLPAVLSVAVAASPDSGYAQDHSGQLPPGAAEVVRLFKFFTVWPFRVQENAVIALFYKVFALLVMGLAGAGLIRKHKSPSLLWLSIWCALPVLPIVIFSYTIMPVWRPRYLLFITPYLFLLLAAGLVRLWKSWRASAVVIAAAYIVAAGGGLFHHYTVQERADYKFNVATIAQYEQPGDGLVWSYECCKRGLHRYYKGDMSPQYHSVATIESPENIPDWIEQFPEGHKRLWLVLDNLAKDKERIVSELAAVYSVEKTFDYEQGSKVILLTPLRESAIEHTEPVSIRPVR